MKMFREIWISFDAIHQVFIRRQIFNQTGHNKFKGHGYETNRRASPHQREVDLLLSGGTMQVPLTNRSQVGLKVDRLNFMDGEIFVLLDLNDVSFPTKGRWNVIKGLSRVSKQLLQKDLNQLSLDLIGSGPDDSSLEPDWIFRGDKLLLSITDGFWIEPIFLKSFSQS